MLDVQQYYCAQPRLQALHLNENPRSILEKMREKTSKKRKKCPIVFGTLFAPGGFAVRDEYF